MTKHYVGPARQTEAPDHREMSPGGGRRPGAHIQWGWVAFFLLGAGLLGMAVLIQLAGGGW